MKKGKRSLAALVFFVFIGSVGIIGCADVDGTIDAAYMAGIYDLTGITLTPAGEATLVLAPPNIEGTITDNSTQTSRRMDSRPLSGQKTRLSAPGLRGDVLLTWGRANRRNRLPKSLDVDGTIRVTIDNPRQIRSEAQLTVRGFGGTFSSFRVRLPAGMVWRESQDRSLDITTLRSTSAEESSG